MWLKVLVDYYNRSTIRDPSGQITRLESKASIGNGLNPIYQGTAPKVAFYSSRGPDVKDLNFQDTNVLKPDILAPGSLIWAAWSPNGTEADYLGKNSTDFLSFRIGWQYNIWDIPYNYFAFMAVVCDRPTF